MVLNITMKASNISLHKSIKISAIIAKDPKDAKTAQKNSMELAMTASMLIGAVFIFTGLVLLFGNLSGDEGIVQLFVWLTFLNVVVGLAVVTFIGIKCVMGPCALSHLDWVSSSFVLIFFIVYLLFWIYFISVANTYVVNQSAS